MTSIAFTSSIPITARPQLTALRSTCVRPNTTVLQPARLPAQLHMSVLSPPTFKQALLDKVTPLNFGRAVADNKLEQEEIEALVRQVEATNKSSSPGTDSNLSGVWNMVYTTSSSILGTGKPAFLQASEIRQEINAAQLTARNEETYKFGPFNFTNAVDAKLKPASANRFIVNFIQFIVFGIFKFNVEKNDRFTGWLSVTYLDDNMRISRGSRGNIFVLVKK